MKSPFYISRVNLVLTTGLKLRGASERTGKTNQAIVTASFLTFFPNEILKGFVDI